jgi:uracil-DNA glycosylase family 4
LLFVGEAPGYNEDKKDRVFIGKTGEEVNDHYLPLASLKRGNVTFTNAIRCLPISAGGKLDPNRAKDVALLDCCANTHLYPLIERMQPRLIIPMGSFACKAVCPEVDLEMQHGIPVETAWGIPAFPMYHPALGLHSPKQMLYIRTDWHRLRKYLGGTLQLPRDPHPEPDYREVTDADDLRELDPTRPLAMDTESSREGPFCLTYSQEPGTGWLLRASRPDLLDRLQGTLSQWENVVLFHNWLYDWPITEAMGLSIPPRRVVDTMVRLYQLGNLPQGLKAVSFRELGMTMQAFEDLVRPYSTAKVVEYYKYAYQHDWPKPEEQMVRDEEGKWKVYKPQGMKTKLKRFFTDLSKAPDKDVFGAWANWSEAHPMIEEELGPWPGMDIRHAPFEQVIHYACRDADATLRLYHLIKKMRPFVRKFSQELWRERVA